jgi:hypothetical protein
VDDKTELTALVVNTGGVDPDWVVAEAVGAEAVK